MENKIKAPQEVIDLILTWNEEWEIYDTHTGKFSKPKSAEYIITFVLEQYKYLLAGNTEIQNIIKNGKSKKPDIRIITKRQTL